MSDGRPDAEVSRLYPPLFALEDRIEPLPVTCVEDLAAKVSALATDEDEDGGTASILATILAECRALLGEEYDAGPLPVLPDPVPLPILETPDLSTPEGRIAATCRGSTSSRPRWCRVRTSSRATPRCSG